MLFKKVSGLSFFYVYHLAFIPAMTVAQGDFHLWTLTSSRPQSHHVPMKRNVAHVSRLPRLNSPSPALSLWMQPTDKPVVQRIVPNLEISKKPQEGCPRPKL